MGRRLVNILPVRAQRTNVFTLPFVNRCKKDEQNYYSTIRTQYMGRIVFRPRGLAALYSVPLVIALSNRYLATRSTNHSSFRFCIHSSTAVSIKKSAPVSKPHPHNPTAQLLRGRLPTSYKHLARETIGNLNPRHYVRHHYT